MPTRTTDHIALKHPITVQVCRAVESGPCVNVASLNLPPGGAGAYQDPLPPELTRGPDRLLRYEVALRNHAGKSAGPSNPAYSAAAASPAALAGVSGQMRSDGVLFSWKPAADGGRSVFFRIERLRVTASAPEEARRSPLAPSLPPAAQTLAVHTTDGSDPGHAVDTSALFNQQYRYVLERVATLELSGHTVEIQGPPSEAIPVTTKDIFAPAVPQGLVAVADTAAGAIDLSWSPDSDSDLAAYRVYRRDVQGGNSAQRIASPGVETSYRDAGVQPEHTYAYSVSAVDQSGNESKPSPEVEETLPRP
jgi:Fibronectin type III domain